MKPRVFVVQPIPEVALDILREAAEVEVEYVEVVSASDLAPLDRLGEQEVLIALAVRIGRARLIDNTTVKPTTRMPASDAAVRATG